MKKIIILSIAFATVLSCDVAKQVAGEILLPPASTGGTSLTNTEVIGGLKQALNVAINNSSSLASKLDGFNGNSLIKLPFPQDAIAVKEFLDDKGILQNQIATFETTLNRAAEDASATAAPIFLNAIKTMSIADGCAILKGGKGAATNFLKEKTTADLVAAFAPIAKNSIEKVELTKYWSPLVSKYNLSTILTGKPKVNENLDQYVTTKAIDGLFVLMATEENKIRTDPVARVTDVLKKVFGSLD
ncbi:MAG: DUF4197 domain-containing protein [Flavobacteriales bacterium]